jgi:lysozyme family protein
MGEDTVWSEASRSINEMDERLQEGATELRAVIEHQEQYLTYGQGCVERQKSLLQHLLRLSAEEQPLARFDQQWRHELDALRARNQAASQRLDHFAAANPPPLALGIQGSDGTTQGSDGAAPLSALATALVDAKLAARASGLAEGQAKGELDVVDFPEWQVELLITAGLAERGLAHGSTLSLRDSFIDE